MISNASIEEYARLAHLFRKALDESYAESKLKTIQYSPFSRKELAEIVLVSYRDSLNTIYQNPHTSQEKGLTVLLMLGLKFTIPSLISHTINLEHCPLSISAIMTFQILISVSK